MSHCNVPSAWIPLGLVLILLLPLGCSTGDDGIFVPEDEGDAACRSSLSEADFGTLTLGAFRDTTVVLRNVGDASLAGRAGFVGGNEGFSLVGGDGFFSLEPGQLRRVTVRFRPVREGIATAELRLSSTCRPITLTGAADPPPLCRVEPAVVDFGNQVEGPTEVSRRVTVHNSGGGEVRIEPALEANCSGFRLGSTGSTVLGPGDSTQVEIILPLEVPGSFFCNLLLGAQCSAVALVGTVNAQPVCRLSEARLEFGLDPAPPVPVGEFLDHSVTLTNTGGGVLSGTVGLGPAGACGPYSVLVGAGDYALESGETHTVTVRFAPQAEGSYVCELGFGCDTVVLDGRAAGPRCELSETSLAMGPVELGQSTTGEVILTNTGFGTLRGTVNPSACSPFEIIEGAGDYALVRNASHTVRIRFTPGNVGLSECDLQTGCGTVQVSGTGVEPPAVCSVSTATLAFGTVVLGDSTSTTFLVSNTGGGTLSGTVTSPCSDFRVDPTTADYSVAAGQSHAVIVRFVPQAVGAAVCTLDTGCSDRVIATGTGQEQLPACALGTSELDFGTVTLGESADRSVTLQNTGGGVLEGTVEPLCPAVSVVGEASYSLASGETHVVTLRFSPTTAGPLSCTISTGCESNIAATGTGFDPPPVCEVTPSTLDFGMLFVGETRVDSLTVRNTGGSLLTGTVASPCSEFVIDEASASYSLAANEAATIRVTYVPGVAGDSDCLLATGCAAGVQATGSAEQPPLCEVGAPSLDFGTVETGSTTDMSVTLTNVGGGTLTGTVALPDCDAFSLVAGSGPYALGAGESITVTARYAPSSAGAHACVIETGCAQDVDLSGTAEAPPLCQVSTGSLSFGELVAGDQANQAFTITNVGGGVLSGSVALSGLSCSDFAILSGGTYALGPNQSVTVAIRFAPGGFGTYNCAATTGCGTQVTLSGAGIVGFQRHLYQPILTQSKSNGGCAGSGCHDWTYPNVTQDDFRLLDFGDPDQSRFLRKASGSISHSGGPGAVTGWQIGGSSYNRFVSWIESGALDN